MSTRIIDAILLLAAFATAAITPAIAAPQQLYGKSVVISWREDRQQRVGGDDQIRPVGVSAEMRVYVSEAGRAFSRLTMLVMNKHGHLKSGNADAVDGVGSGPKGNFARTVNFNGATMIVGQPRGAGGAQQVLVRFDSGFQTCSAQVIVGRSSKSGSISTTSLINGQHVEIFSVAASGESCHVQSGNVFAN
jgi:hypothetical protein